VGYRYTNTKTFIRHDRSFSSKCFRFPESHVQTYCKTLWTEGEGSSHSKTSPAKDSTNADINLDTSIHIPSGIRTRDSSTRAVGDSTRLRRCGPAIDLYSNCRVNKSISQRVQLLVSRTRPPGLACPIQNYV
jgi:hypothetical protein